MEVICPTCKKKYNIDESKLPAGGMKARCFGCSNVFEVKPPQVVAPIAQPKVDIKKVVVANSSKAVCDAVSMVVSKEPGFVVFKETDGIDAMNVINKEIPDIVIIDVALPRLFGFEICDQIRATENLKHIKIILVASIYSKTSYKRRPDTLYGADDYIEKHHIHNDLIPKIHGLLTGVEFKDKKDNLYIDDYGNQPEEQGTHAVTVPVEPTPEAEQAEEQVYINEEAHVAPTSDSSANDNVEARRFARLIVSDIALYSDEAIVSAIHENKFYEAVESDFSEGVELFHNRFGNDGLDAEVYLKDAFDEFLQKKRKALGMA